MIERLIQAATRFGDGLAGSMQLSRPALAIVQMSQMLGYELLAVTHPDHEQTRSPKWKTVRKLFIAENPVCVVSGLKTDLDVHHLVPFHRDPGLELVKSNLRTVQRPFHYLLGHLCNWSTYNPDFDEMVREIRAKIAESKRNY